MIVRFAVKQSQIHSHSESYDWVESDNVADLIRTRDLVVRQVTDHKIQIKVWEVDGTCHQGIDALQQIPLLAIKYRLPSGQVIVRSVTPKKDVGYNPIASCLEALRVWRNIHQRDTEDGLISEACYFDGSSQDWKPALLPDAVPA